MCQSVLHAQNTKMNRDPNREGLISSSGDKNINNYDNIISIIG